MGECHEIYSNLKRAYKYDEVLGFDEMPKAKAILRDSLSIAGAGKNE